jgi:putative tryptophan/tyrosine transport system substrate-binding protein
MRRRDFITLLGGAAVAWPLAARAQRPERVRQIGILMNNVATDSLFQSYVAAFVQALRNLGWVDGQNVRIDVRWNGGDAERAHTYAAEIVALAPDAILCASTTNLMALQQATRSVPIVFLQVSDPVAQGIVPNLVHPGGNVTGFMNFEFSIGGKWVELLKQIAPELMRVAVMFNPDTSPQSKYFLRSIEATALSLGVQAVTTPVRATADIEPVIESFAHQPNSGLILPTDSFTTVHSKLIADLTLRYRLPAISGNSDNFERGSGLMYYGTTSAGVTEQYRQAAAYVDRILKGAKPGDLPIQLATGFKLVINLKTAKALGLNVPNPLIGRADEVIE